MNGEHPRSIIDLLEKLEGVHPSNFGHAAGLLNLLRQVTKDEKLDRYPELLGEVRKKIELGHLPQNALEVIGFQEKSIKIGEDTLGYEEEPTDWRE